MLSATESFHEVVLPERAPVLAFGLLVFLILALQFGPAAGLIGFRLTGDDKWALIGVVRDLAVIVLVALALTSMASAKGQPLSGSARWALALVAVYAALALVSSTNLLLLALNLRRLALVPLLFVAVLIIPWTRAQVDRIFSLIVITSVIVAILGIAERIGPERLWTELLDIESYTAANGFDRFGLLKYHESGRFFSWDLELWTGGPLRRMLSTYLEPTTLAAGMSVALVIGLARRARGHASLFLCLLAVICGVLTMSKGFFLFLLALLSWRLIGTPSPRHILPLAAAAAGAALVLTGKGLTDGPFSHLSGIESALKYLLEGHLLGEGIGEAGNYTNAETDVGAESGLGNTIAQAGIAAIVPLLWIRAVARDVLNEATARQDPGGQWMAGWAVFWILSFVFSASSQGVGGNALGFAALALYLHPSAHGAER